MKMFLLYVDEKEKCTPYIIKHTFKKVVQGKRQYIEKPSLLTGEGGFCIAKLG